MDDIVKTICSFSEYQETRHDESFISKQDQSYITSAKSTLLSKNTIDSNQKRHDMAL